MLVDYWQCKVRVAGEPHKALVKDLAVSGPDGGRDAWRQLSSFVVFPGVFDTCEVLMQQPL